MDLVKEAIFLGFSGAAVMDTTQLVFVPEYRMFCEENLCGCYNVNPACPPESGTVEEMKQRALQYEKTLVLQTMQEDAHDPSQYKKDKLMQNKMTEELAEKMKVLQQELLDRTERRENYDDIATEILRIRELQEQSNMDSVTKAEHKKRIQELQRFIKSQPTDVTNFDERLVKNLLSQIIIHDDFLEFKFKSGVTVSIEK